MRSKLDQKPSDTNNPFWHLEGDGLLLCRRLKTLWVDTLRVWNDPTICEWSGTCLYQHGLTTIALLDAMSCDYVYRTNATVPSEGLFAHLESRLNMPASFQAMHAAWEQRHSQHPAIGEPLHRRLAMIALCRPNVAYPLHDTVQNSTIWSDMPDLHFFWDQAPFPEQSKHESLYRGLLALPSSMENFYAYAAQDRIPEKTVQHLLDNCMPRPTEYEDTGLMSNWCGWLATVQNNAAQWRCVKERFPQLAATIEMVSCLEEPSRVGALSWEMHRAHTLPDVVAKKDVEYLFGN